MTELEHQIERSRRQLTANRWFGQICVSTMAAAGTFAVVALTARLFGWNWPLGWIALGLTGTALLASSIWTALRRIDANFAAAALDEAAGLRERISSGLYCVGHDDPFERAVFSDAESVSRSLTVSQHLRLQMPRQWPSTLVTVLAAAAMLLVPSGLLVKSEADTLDQQVQARQAVQVIKKRTEELRRVARTNPALKQLAEDLDKLGEGPDASLQQPRELRRTALKKLDRMQDVLKQQRGANRFEQTKEFKKMLRGLKTPKQPDTAAAKLTKALANGDFKTAKEITKQMQEQLAKLSTTKDAAKLKAMQKQLDELAKKLDQLAQDKKLKEQLAQAGLKKEDIERMLQNLTKKDLDQFKKQLEKQGFSQKAIEDLANKLMKRQGAMAMAKQLSQALKQAGKSAGAGQTGDAMGQMGKAGDMLSEMEMLEQEMNQIDSTLADLQNAKNDLNNACSTCNGTGMAGNGMCPGCGGSGMGKGGMGRNMGQGRGGIASEQQTQTGFVKRRQKVHTGKGAIIGQFLVDGEQIKGGVSGEFAELATAAVRDATDAVNRDRIPRQYHEAIKKYFSDVQNELAKDGSRPAEESGAAQEDEKPSGQSGDDASDKD